MEEAAFDFEGLVELPEILPVGKYSIQFVPDICVLLVFAILQI